MFTLSVALKDCLCNTLGEVPIVLAARSAPVLKLRGDLGCASKRGYS